MEDEFTEADEASSTESKPNWRRDLEARASEGDEAKKELQQLKRKEVFRDAGLDTSNKMTEYFMKGYEGDLSVEAIQAEANDAGLSNMTTDASSTNLAQDTDALAERRIQHAADDAGPVTNPALDELIRQTTNADELRTLWESNGGTWNAAV
jgi:hypothetical protein